MQSAASSEQVLLLISYLYYLFVMNNMLLQVARVRQRGGVLAGKVAEAVEGDGDENGQGCLWNFQSHLPTHPPSMRANFKSDSIFYKFEFVEREGNVTTTAAIRVTRQSGKGRHIKGAAAAAF